MNLNKTVLTRVGILVYLIVVAFSGTSHAQLLGTWAFNGNTTGTAGGYNTVSTADFSAAVTNKGYSGSVYYGEKNWSAAGLNTADYFQFSLTPAAGQSLNILNMVLSMRRSSTGSPAGSGPRSFSVRSSLDNYTSDIFTGSLTHNIGNYSVTLMGFTLLSATISFRIYGYNAATTSGGLNRLVFDNINVTGSNIILSDNQTEISAKNQGGRVAVAVHLQDIFPHATYTIERSTDALKYYAINTLDPGKIINKTYSFNDILSDNVRGKLFYRLQIQKEDGSVLYTNIASVNVEPKADRLKLLVRRSLITISSDIPGPCIFTLMSASGACMLKKNINNASLNNTFTLPPLPSGIYYGCLLGKKLKDTKALMLLTTY